MFWFSSGKTVTSQLFSWNLSWFLLIYKEKRVFRTEKWGYGETVSIEDLSLLLSQYSLDCLDKKQFSSKENYVLTNPHTRVCLLHRHFLFPVSLALSFLMINVLYLGEDIKYILNPRIQSLCCILETEARNWRRAWAEDFTCWRILYEARSVKLHRLYERWEVNRLLRCPIMWSSWNNWLGGIIISLFEPSRRVSVFWCKSASLISGWFTTGFPNEWSKTEKFYLRWDLNPRPLDS